MNLPRFEKPLFNEKKREQKLESKTTTPEAKGTRNPWTTEEQEKFIEAIRAHGKDFKKIEEHIGTRDRRQIASYCQKWRLRNKAIHPDLVAIMEAPLK